MRVHRVVCEHCLVAERPWGRMRGLLGRQLPRGEGILLRPAGSIHTFFMRFAIDAVFLDRSISSYLGSKPSLGPWRTAGTARGAKSVVESACSGERARSGAASRSGIP